MFEQIRQDAGYAARQLVRAPSFAFAAALTLSLGIGVTVAVFSVVNAVVLQPLPYPAPDRIVNLHPTRAGAPLGVASNLEFASWRKLSQQFEAVAGVVSQSTFVLARGSAPEVILGARASADYLRVLGVAPALGRGFAPDEDRPGAPPVVILSHALWTREYGADRGILGRSVRIDDQVYTVIGVMPASFDRTGNGDQLWLPMSLSSADLTEFQRRYLQVVARLANGVTPAQASAAIAEVERQLSAEHVAWGTGYAAEVRRLSDDSFGNLRPPLFTLLGAVAFVFLIACVNVANLVMTRGSARQREVAIRTALGASRTRLISQFLVEGGVLCVGAGAVGVALAYGLLRALVAFSPPGVPRIEQASIDTTALAFAAGMALLCNVFIGLFPALRGTVGSLQGRLRESARNVSESASRGRARNALVAGEIALAMALLTGAALLIRTAWELSHVDPGFSADHVLTAQVLMPTARYPDLATGARAYRTIREQLSTVSGVESVAMTSTLPLGNPIRAGIGAEGKPFTDGARLLVDTRVVTPSYFGTMKIRLQAGRDFAMSDDAGHPLVVIISDALAAKLWPGENAIGHRLEGMDPSHTHLMEVVGVIAGPHDVSLAQAPAPEMYIPLEQAPPLLWTGVRGSLSIVMRTRAQPETMDHAVRTGIDLVDPSLPTANVTTMSRLVSASTASSEFNTMLLSLLGGIALILAAIGVYGVITDGVRERTREIAVRLALGASPQAIAGLVVRRALIPVAAGAVVGTFLSIVTTRLLREQLFNIAPGDPLTIVAISALLLGVAALAASIPARRAMQLAPARVLT